MNDTLSRFVWGVYHAYIQKWRRKKATDKGWMMKFVYWYEELREDPITWFYSLSNEAYVCGENHINLS